MNVAPQNIENCSSSGDPAFPSRVIGRRRPFLTTLVTLDRTKLERVRRAPVRATPSSTALVERYIEELNAQLWHARADPSLRRSSPTTSARVRSS
jgi:hypothetical protein